MKKFTTILLVVILLAGLSLLLYPTVSDYWNSLHQSRAIASYAQEVANMDNSAYEQMLRDAMAYNASLLERTDRFAKFTDEDKEVYDSLLNINGSGAMGYIEIKKIGVSLPIYHGTNEDVLQIAIGHLEGSSLPVGGAGTHSVFSGHRGLPSAKLFTDLGKMAEGDTFVLRTLDEVLTYQVDQIRTVLPAELSALEIDPRMDYCTLVTCTPYGINTHRMLVRGHRVENETEARTIRITADAAQVDPVMVAPVMAVPLMLMLMLSLSVGDTKKKR